MGDRHLVVHRQGSSEPNACTRAGGRDVEKLLPHAPRLPKVCFKMGGHVRANMKDVAMGFSHGIASVASGVDDEKLSFAVSFCV